MEAVERFQRLPIEGEQHIYIHMYIWDRKSNVMTKYAKNRVSAPRPAQVQGQVVFLNLAYLRKCNELSFFTNNRVVHIESASAVRPRRTSLGIVQGRRRQTLFGLSNCQGMKMHG
jgi:hypothetical protein